MTGPKACPICRGPIGPRAALPFCSERCKLVDLGSWLGESYRINGEPVDGHSLIGDGSGDAATLISENECDS